MSYKYKKEVNLSFEDAVLKVKEELKKEGFGVLTEADFKKALKEKINVDYDNYIVLGACSPTNAYKALQAEKDIGLLLPCNVIVYVDDNKTYVLAINPVSALSVANVEGLEEIAKVIKEKLEKVVDSVE